MHGSSRLVFKGLEGHYYADPDIMVRERSVIFEASWQLVCSSERLAQPGDYLATRLAGVDIIVIRGKGGEISGFRNACTHRGARLLQSGEGHCETISCPYHGWQFDHEGNLVDTPWFDEPSPFDRSGLGLNRIDVDTWRGLIFVAIRPTVSLVDQLGDLPGELANVPIETFSAVANRRFAAGVNWKCYLDQFTENYHVPIVHSPDKSVEIEKYTVTDGNSIVVLAAPDQGKFFGGRWIWGWPNWTLSLFPGGMKTSRLEPTSPTSFDIYFDFYFADLSPESESNRSRVVETTKIIFEDDLRACELVQGNYASGNSRPGPLHPGLENGVAYFQTRIREALEAR